MKRRKDDNTQQTPPGDRKPMPRWSKLLLTLSVILMLAGGGLWIVSAFVGAGEAARPQTAELPEGVTGFAESGDATTTPPGDDGAAGDSLEVWSPTVFRLGFSFFVGFCVAYAVRSFLKIFLLIAGVILLGVFALQYFGLLEMDWAAMDTVFQDVGGWLKGQVASFQEFITGALPSAAMGGLGLVSGFRR